MLQQTGPRCVKEILDESQAMLLAEDNMLVDVSSETRKFKEQAAVKRSSTFRLSQINEHQINGQPLVGQRKKSRFVSLKSEILHRNSIYHLQRSPDQHQRAAAAFHKRNASMNDNLGAAGTEQDDYSMSYAAAAK